MKIRLWYRRAWLWPIVLVFLSLPGCTLLAGQDIRSDTPGVHLKIGNRIPELSGVDQFAEQQNFESLRGQNGLVLLFFRSADW